MGAGKVAPEECKVLAIAEMGTPKTKTDVRAALGLLGYYKKFIPGFASNSVHLFNATKKTSPIKVDRTKDMEIELQYLKNALTTVPVLTTPAS